MIIIYNDISCILCHNGFVDWLNSCVVNDQGILPPCTLFRSTVVTVVWTRGGH